MYVLCITAVLSLLSVSNAEPLPCEEIVKPMVLEDFSKVLGKWILIEGAMDNPDFDLLLRSANSSWAEVVATHDNDAVIFRQGSMLNGTCVRSSLNLTLSHNTMYFHYPVNTKGNSTVTLLRASTEYMVMFGISFTEGVRVKTIHLLGRTGKLSNFDRETYDRQMECLAMPKPVFTYDEHQELCPDENSHKEEPSEGESQQEKSV